MQQAGKFRAGTSGLVLAEPNKAAYPPAYQDKSRLEFYASRFNSIEINSSFYKIPRALTYKKWADMVPADFQFTVKLWQGITHEKNHVSLQEHLEMFFEAVDALGTHKGCLLIQLPAGSVLRQSEFLDMLESIRKVDHKRSWRLAVEFRHPKWYNSNIHTMLDAFGVSMVLHDMPKALPDGLNQKAPFVYLRFHGEKGDYRGSYDDNFLQEKARQIKTWLAEGRDVYAYFNNTMGAAAANLATLISMVKAAH